MLLGLYQLLWTALAYLAEVVARWKPDQKAQLVRAKFSADILDSFRKERAQRGMGVVFFCSSAGEYEQAKPLARLLAEERDAFVVFVMGSASGVKFAKAQNESMPFVLAPWDKPREWAKLMSALQPQFTVIVRYELWPGFLSVASKAGPVFLIDAVQSESLKRSRLSRWLWQRLLGAISHIFVVGSDDGEFYKSYLAREDRDLSLVGDTKYDRVLERMEERAVKRQKIAEVLQPFISGHRIILMGSAWPEDLSEMLKVLCELKIKEPHLKLIVAPHDVSASMAQKMLGMVTQVGLRVCRSSVAGMAAVSETDDVLLLDEIGFLPEMYALADVAWVGGAMHHRVHNVLEPACWGLYVCFGPHFETSQEARSLVARGLAKVIHSGQDFFEWFQTLNISGRPPHKALWAAVEAERGASRRILSRIDHEIWKD